MCKIDINKCLDPNYTNTSVNIISYVFKMKYCQEFLDKYKGTPNYITSASKIKNFFHKTIYKIRNHQADIDALVKDLDNSNHFGRSILLKIIAQLIQIIPSIAVGPEILDPIIIEINKGTLPTVHKVVENFASSPIRPIIILLLDSTSNMNLIPDILKKLPINLRVAIHNDSGETNIVTVLKNDGASDINEFMDCYASQCFSTCANTNQEIILSNADNKDDINLISKLFIKCHSSLLIDNKLDALEDIKAINVKLHNSALQSDVKNLFMCINSLNHVYATDSGGQSILDAINLSDELNNPLIKAFVHRYAHFIPNTTYQEKSDLLNSAADEFNKRNILDHKIYCINNALTYSFYKDNIDIGKFNGMLAEALNNVPGIAGMSILYNNVGTALLYYRDPENALKKYKSGLDYATALNRPAQRIGLLGNIAITEALLGIKHTTEYFINTSKDILNMPNTRNLPFIQVNGLLNLIAAAIYENNKDAALQIYASKNFLDVLSKSLVPNMLGSGSLVTQLKVLVEKSNGLLDFNFVQIPSSTSHISGIRHDYITENGFNPAIGNAWL